MNCSRGRPIALITFFISNPGICVSDGRKNFTRPAHRNRWKKTGVVHGQRDGGLGLGGHRLPPMLPLADTTIWMRLADAIMLVTRPGVTTKSQLQRSLETIEQSKLLGAVLNASTEATAGKYYYHYSRKSAAIPIESSVAK